MCHCRAHNQTDALLRATCYGFSNAKDCKTIFYKFYIRACDLWIWQKYGWSWADKAEAVVPLPSPPTAT